MSAKIRPMFVLAVALVAFSLVSCSTAEKGKSLSKTERARLLVEAANGAIAENDPIGALQFLKQAEQQDSQLPELYHSQAIAFFMKKELNSAILSAQKAVSLKEDFSDANNTLGKLFLDAGDYAAAEKPLLKASADPLYREAFKARTNLGILYYRLGDLKKSENNLSQAIIDSPANACIAYYYRGHIQLKKGLLKDAINDYTLATKKFCGTLADAHLALGIAYERNKQFDAARKKYLEISQNFANTKVAEQAMEHLRYLP